MAGGSPNSIGSVSAALGAAVLLAVPHAAAQNDPLRFLRPSVEAAPGAETPAGAPLPPPAPTDPPPSAVEAGPQIPGTAVPEALPSLQTGAPEDQSSDGVSPDEAEPPAAADATPGPTGDADANASGGPPRDEPPRPLRLGVIAGRDARLTLNALEPLAQRLTDSLARPVEILPMSSYGAMIDAQALGRLDGGFFSAAAYALAEARCACLEPLAAPTAPDGATSFYAVIVARRDSGIGSIADLAGRTVAGGAPDSLAGRRMQVASLAAEGVDPARAFGAFRDAGSSEEAVRMVASGAVDAAFAWSSMSGDAATGYSRGTLASLAARGEVEMGDLAIIWRSPAITHGPLAVRAALTDSEKTAIEGVLVALDDLEPGAFDTLSPYYEGGYVAVGPQDYAGLAVLADPGLDLLELPSPPDEAGDSAPRRRN